jgi:hypothetical protein
MDRGIAKHDRAGSVHQAEHNGSPYFPGIK